MSNFPPEILITIFNHINDINDICSLLLVSNKFSALIQYSTRKISSKYNKIVPGDWIKQFNYLREVNSSIIIKLLEGELPQLVIGTVYLGANFRIWEFPSGDLKLKLISDDHIIVLSGKINYSFPKVSIPNTIHTEEFIMRTDYCNALMEMIGSYPTLYDYINIGIKEISENKIINLSDGNHQRILGLYFQLQGLDYRITDDIRIILKKYTGSDDLLTLIVNAIDLNVETYYLFDF